MKDLFRSVFAKNREPAAQAASWRDPSFDMPAYVVGDIHGRMDLLQKLLAKLDSQIPVVLVGDYIDRGEESAQVLRFLAERPHLLCLAGNHEQMLLDVLDDPIANTRIWLRNGGLQTLLSFGVRAPDSQAGSMALMQMAADLRRKLGDDVIAWLRDLPHFLRVNNVVVVHAALDPAKAVEDQTVRTMMWGHRDFLTTPRTDGLWVVHGHTIVDKPHVHAGRIAIDTGAYASGVLTAALFDGGPPKFIQTP